jgi:hypothetical protein
MMHLTPSASKLDEDAVAAGALKELYKMLAAELQQEEKRRRWRCGSSEMRFGQKAGHARAHSTCLSSLFIYKFIIIIIIIIIVLRCMCSK